MEDTKNNEKSMCTPERNKPKMEGNQKINCTVSSCRFNNDQKNICELEAIKVAPVKQVNTQKPDESMCSSYEYQQNQQNQQNAQN